MPTEDADVLNHLSVFRVPLLVGTAFGPHTCQETHPHGSTRIIYTHSTMPHDIAFHFHA